MKKIIMSILLFSVSMLNVYALDGENYYVNENGVKFTEKQYNFFSKMYWDGYQEYMTQNDFDYYDVNLMDDNLVETTYYNFPQSRASSITNNGKTLKISKTDSNTCSNISVTLTWNNMPSVLSYDVIGARLNGVSLLNTPITRLYNNTGSTNFDISVKSNNGFGASVLLFGTNMRINQTYRVSKGGTVYASYQHATRSISLANSKNYTISSTGYGSVFKFSGTALTTYDGMNGVSISV